MLPLAPSHSRLPWAVENLRFCPWCDQLAQKDLNDCPTCGRRMGPLERRGAGATAEVAAPRVAAPRRPRRGAARARLALGALRRRTQRLRRGAEEHARTSPRRPTRAPKRRPRQTTSTSTTSTQTTSTSAKPARPRIRRAAKPPKRRPAQNRGGAERGTGGGTPAAEKAETSDGESRRVESAGRQAARARRAGRGRPAAAHARGASAAPARALGGRDQRRAVGQAGGLVEAVVLHRSCRSAVCVVCALVLVHCSSGGSPARRCRCRSRARAPAPRWAPSARRVALLDRDRGFERELGGLAEVRLRA